MEKPLEKSVDATNDKKSINCYDEGSKIYKERLKEIRDIHDWDLRDIKFREADEELALADINLRSV